MKTGDIITTFIFDKGQLKMVPLPVEPKYHDGYSYEHASATIDYEKACAYARAHPIDVHPNDQEKAKELISKSLFPVAWYPKSFIDNWIPNDLTEYKLEGVRMEIKEEKFTMPKTTIRGQHEVIERGGQVVVKQVACLIEDDVKYQRPTNFENVRALEDDKIENNDCICSCGGGENNGHDWNCPWQEEES